MKIIKIRSCMGGTGKASVRAANDADGFLTRMKKRIVEIKCHLSSCIDDHTDAADQVAVSVALLEMAVDRFIETHGPKDALDVIDTALGRAGLKVTSTLQ